MEHINAVRQGHETKPKRESKRIRVQTKNGFSSIREQNESKHVNFSFKRFCFASPQYTQYIFGPVVVNVVVQMRGNVIV